MLKAQIGALPPAGFGLVSMAVPGLTVQGPLNRPRETRRSRPSEPSLPVPKGSRSTA
jgi:hypothetical protein